MQRVRGVLVVLVCLHAPHAVHALHAQSPRDVLSIPFPSDLVASPDGRTLAWFANESGRRNVWVAEAPSFRARRLTAYQEDDGQPLSQLTWTRDSRSLFYVRGGAPGSNWDVTVPVSPTSDPDGAEQVIFAVSLAGGAPRRVSTGHTPTPGRDRLALIRGDTLHLGPLRGPGGTWNALRVRGTSGTPVWSPDGARLAFVSNRADHSFIGIYDPDRDAVTWVAPGSWRDNFPRWSADGSRLAFIRRTGLAFAQGVPLPPLRDSTLGPFMIAVTELAQPGDARVVYRSAPGADGALPGLGGGWSLQWAAGDTLLFASEQTGWLGLYRTTAAGSPAERLTPGGCEIRDVRLTADRGGAIYASNCGDTDRMHIQQVRIAGGSPQTVTSGAGLEWSPTLLADGRVFGLRSTTRCPATAGFVDAPLTCDGFEWAGEPRPVVVRAADSVQIHLQVFEPRLAVAGSRLPAVLFFHGGPQRQMLLGWHDRGYYHNAYGFNQLLAARGFVVVSVNYRGGIGYGRAFREAPRRGRLGASEYQDVLAALGYLRSRGDVDSARIGLWGGSYGGYLTALGLARNSDVFAAGFDLHGVHDYAVNRQGQTTGSDSAVAVARRASPVGDLSRWRSPVLLVAGDDDRNVEFQQTTDLALRLRRLGVPVEELVFPDDVHSFLRYENWVRAFQAGLDFFERTLRSRVASR